ncbi:site-specific recombinase XerD [Paraburkholderia sp. BL8N3]|nr:site-specific recombinase XerD [Paraburkholderia sp. BL8N3]
MPFRLVTIYPSGEFFSRERLASAAGFSSDQLPLLRLFHLPKVGIILDPEGMPQRTTSRFLTEVALRSRSATGDTVRTYGECLSNWLNYLEIRGLSDLSANEIDLKTYRSFLARSELGCGMPNYCGSTVNLRVSCAARYHLWCFRNGIFKSPLGTWLYKRTTQQNEKLKSPYRMGSIGVTSTRARMPRILSKEELDAIFRVAGEPYSLILRWAICSGLRRFEICAIDRRQIMRASSYGPIGSGIVQLEVTRKGGKSLPIFVPRALVEQTQTYIARTSHLANENAPVFITTRGGQIDRKTVTRKFRELANGLSINATFHHMRHTYAATMLGLLSRSVAAGAEINPLKTLQILMGHASLSSTEVYLAAIELNSGPVSDALAYLLGDRL